MGEPRIALRDVSGRDVRANELRDLLLEGERLERPLDPRIDRLARAEARGAEEETGGGEEEPGADGESHVGRQ